MIPAPPPPLLAVCSEEMELGAGSGKLQRAELPASWVLLVPHSPGPLPRVTLPDANPLGLVSIAPWGWASLEAAQTLIPADSAWGQHRPISRIASRLLPSSFL